MTSRTTGRTTGRARLALVFALAAGGASACREHQALKYQCLTDAECADDEGCTGGACVPFARLPAEWGVELEPLTSGVSGLTEQFPLAPSAAAVPATLDLVAPDEVLVAGAVAVEASADPLSRAHVVLTVPPVIGGRPDLVYETQLSMGAASSVPTFGLPLPAGVMGRTGALRVLPTGGDVRTRAPGLISLVIEPSADVALPSKSVTVRGRLLNVFREPKSGMIVRAFLSGGPSADLVSNAATTADDGTFSLVVPTSLLGAAPSQSVAVEVSPPPGNTVDPRLTTKPFTVAGNVDLGDLALPAFAQPNVFRFAVHGDTPDGPAVGRALVRARTQLADDASGITEFVRAGNTDRTGSTDLALLPGLTMALRKFEIAVVPPPDSPFGIKCIPSFQLAAGGTAMFPASPPVIVLGRRTWVSATVRDARKKPLEGVVVRATRTQVDGAIPCAASVPVDPATATSDANGRFDLFLDPGSYRFDYDPPAGSPSPRLTTSLVVVAASTSTQVSFAQDLPDGALVDGTARDSQGRPLPYAAVRLFEVACTAPETCTGPARVPPTLRAETRADTTGRFRIVFPRP